ncbi:hypothetical protein BDY24DRAFT_436733 [Mrakia frigida]|uniref:uncharacterized protein n=1 Tax=Mrakia frigida TaxID=29902 RepID=UPI003FCC0D21
MNTLISSPLHLLRTGAYSFLLVLHIVLLALAGTWNSGSGSGSDWEWTTTIFVMFFMIPVSFVLVSCFLIFTYKGHSLRLETIFLLAVTAIWTGLAGGLTEHYIAYRGQACRVSKPDWWYYNCALFDAIFAFVWINAIFSVLCLVASIGFGVMQTKKRNASVWSLSIIELLAASPKGAVRMDSRVSDV